MGFRQNEKWMRRILVIDLISRIARILRFLASHGLISEVGEDIFEANRLTKTLSVNGYRAGMNQT